MPKPDTSTFAPFDMHCVVGRHLKWRHGQPHASDDLLADMDHHAIAEAMVLHSLSRENHPADGNPLALEIAASDPRLHPAWSVLPHGAEDEQLPPAQLLEEMRRQKVGALYLFPNQFRFSLSDWCVDALLAPLADARVPVVIDPVEIGPTNTHTMDGTDWDAVVALCRRWPALPVIVSEHRIRRSQRLMYRTLDACENLHIELSGLWLHRAIEFITGRWGACRLVFGSRWPMLGQHMTLATLRCADIGEDDKRLIAGDNWRRLIGWCAPEHPHIEPLPPADEFIAFGRSGKRPAGMAFQDCHGHIGPHASHYHLPNSSLDEVVADMERLGVEQACVFGFTGVFTDERPGNDLVIEAVRRHPDLFVGFTMLNPHRGPEEMRRELERCAAMGLRGVKLIPHYQGYPPEGPHIEVGCRWAHEHRQLILNHHWGSVRQMERLLTEFPDACFITGHCTTAYAELMQRFDNLYVCSCPLLGPRAAEETVAVIGADRLLFGSDLEDLPIAWGLGPILFARLSTEEKRLILGENLRRLLQRYSRR